MFAKLMASAMKEICDTDTFLSYENQVVESSAVFKSCYSTKEVFFQYVSRMKPCKGTFELVLMKRSHSIVIFPCPYVPHSWQYIWNKIDVSRHEKEEKAMVSMLARKDYTKTNKE